MNTQQILKRTANRLDDRMDENFAHAYWANAERLRDRVIDQSTTSLKERYAEIGAAKTQEEVAEKSAIERALASRGWRYAHTEWVRWR